MRSTLEQRGSDHEVISMITLEGQSLLFFHLWRAWMQVNAPPYTNNIRCLRGADC
jgi:hypothetical protein